MKKHIQFHRNPEERDLWLKQRKHFQGENQPDVCRLGGSDVSKPLGLDRWTAPIVFFHQMTGRATRSFTDNMEAYRGRTSEEHIYRNYWVYYDPAQPSEEVFLENASKLKPIRKARRKNFMVYNERYPHLFANIDYEIVGRYTPKGCGPGILELKNVRRREVEQHVDNIPRNYLVQMNTYAGIMERKYCELFMLIDATYPVLIDIPFSKALFESTVEQTNNFCQRVIEVKSLIASGAPEDEIQVCIAENEPGPDGSDSYKEFLKDNYNPDTYKGSIQGDTEQLEWARRYHKAKDQESGAKKLKQQYQNQLKHVMKQHEVDEISFDGLGSITWREDSRGVQRMNIPENLKEKETEEV